MRLSFSCRHFLIDFVFHGQRDLYFQFKELKITTLITYYFLLITLPKKLRTDKVIVKKQREKRKKRLAFASRFVIALQNRSAALPRHILFHAHQKEFFSYRFSKENLPLITLVVQIEWLLQISRQIQFCRCQISN